MAGTECGELAGLSCALYVLSRQKNRRFHGAASYNDIMRLGGLAVAKAQRKLASHASGWNRDSKNISVPEVRRSAGLSRVLSGPHYFALQNQPLV
jgi:hypothetical protein